MLYKMSGMGDFRYFLACFILNNKSTMDKCLKSSKNLELQTAFCEMSGLESVIKDNFANSDSCYMNLNEGIFREKCLKT